jgi:hypothetical protein
MKPVPYSPFNRTYKYTCLQNQLAHNKNKKGVKGLVDSNIHLNSSLQNISRTTQHSGRPMSSSLMLTKSLSGSVYGKLKQ